jgi:hypothetical protein
MRLFCFHDGELSHRKQGTAIMTNIENKPAVDAAALRSALASASVSADKAAGKAGNAARSYAEYLETTLPAGWDDMTFKSKADDDSNEKAMVRGERDALVDALKAAKHSNPDMVWKRVKEAAKALRKEAAKAAALAAHIAAGGTEEDFEGDIGTGKAVRSPRERNIAELGKLLKANVAALAAQGDKRDAALVEATEAIAVALRALGEKVELVSALIAKATDKPAK